MPGQRRFAENDPLHHATKLKHMLTEVIDHAREDVSKVSEPRAKALFEKTANLLSDLRKEYEGYEHGDESRWRQVS